MLNPMLVVAAEIAQRGTEVWFACDEEHQDDVEKVEGLRFASLGPEIPELTPTKWDEGTYREITQRTKWKALRATALHTWPPSLRPDKYVRLSGIADEVKPGLIVTDTIARFAGRLAITRKIPYVIAAPFMPSNVLFPRVPKGFPMPNSGLPLKMSLGQKISHRMLKLRKMRMMFNPTMVNALKGAIRTNTELGISKESGAPGAIVEHAELLLSYTVPGMDYPIPLPEKMHLLGAMVPPLPEAPPGELTSWLDAHESIVYMGLGTITRLTRQQVEAFVDVARKLDGQHHVLWKLPRAQQDLLPEALPPNLRVEAWVPSQLDVLAHPHVRLFLNHGGGGGFNEGLYFGKPMVIYPLWVDCHDQAVRGEDAGISLTLNNSDTIDVEDVVSKITRVLTEPSFRERAEEFRARQLAAGGRETAATMILDVYNRLGA